jgi:hypothetical protein
MGTLGVTPAALLQELRAAGAALRVPEGCLEAKHLPPHFSALTKAHAVELRRLLAGPVPAVEALALPEPSPARDPEPESPRPLAPPVPIEAPAGVPASVPAAAGASRPPPVPMVDPAPGYPGAGSS